MSGYPADRLPNHEDEGKHFGGDEPPGHDSHGEHGGIAKYVYVFIALCLLTSASFFTYSEYWPFHHIPAVGWIFMMAVSCSKALLVMLFFMHLKYEADWKYVLTIPASIMSLFLAIALVPDVGMRMNRYSEERKHYIATPAENDLLLQESANLAKAHRKEAAHKGESEGH